MEYRPRLLESRIKNYMDDFGAVVIIGPKWCGKTTTAERFAKSSVYLQDNLEGKKYRQIAKIRPRTILDGEKPRLIDEWQEAPELWDSIRHYVDDAGEPGQFILTGSAVVNRKEIKHDGTGRYGELRMRTLSLFEYGESTGEVSLGELFEGRESIEGTSRHSIDDICRLIVRGSWPSSIGRSDDTAMDQVQEYCESIVNYGMSSVDNVKRDPRKSRLILRSLARSTASQVSVATIKEDIEEHNGTEIHENTIYGYIGALDKLFITDDVTAWTPDLRSKTAIRTSDTRYLTDPAISAYFLEAGAEDLIYDPRTLGLLFENMVIRDLRVYAQTMKGKIHHYRDKNDLEADAIIHLRNGRWGAIEVKLDPDSADAGAATLLKLKEKVDDSYQNKLSFLAVITSTGYAYTRPDGVHVIPIGCLRN